MVGEKHFNMVEKAPSLTDQITSSERECEALWRTHLDDVREHWQASPG